MSTTTPNRPPTPGYFAREAAVIADNIRRAIKAHPTACRQEIVAVSVDLTPAEFSEYMTGKRIWELVLLFDVARVLDVEASDLLEGL